MAKTVRDARLETRAARERLTARAKPYYRSIEEGLHVGYRKGKRGGKWVLRWYVGEEKYVVETLGIADDVVDADGVAILNYSQAQTQARQRASELAHQAAGIEYRAGPYTVKDAIDEYLAWMAQHRKTVKDARVRANALILPSLGEIQVSKLTTAKIRQWLKMIAETPARLRTRADETQRYRHEDADDPEVLRRRRASANRVLTILKAALNHAWREGRVASDDAWRRVKPYRSVDAARVRYLTRDECIRLINACEPEFRSLVQAALATGARYGELTALRVVDFNPDKGTVHIRQSKAGKGRHVILTDEGVTLFTRLSAGRPGDAHLFVHEDGSTWQKSHQTRPMRAACERASIAPPISFHGLRHTYASLSVMAGLPLMVLAQNLGHADSRMVEKHYGHLAESYVAEMIRAGAPRFGMNQDNVVALNQRR